MSITKKWILVKFDPTPGNKAVSADTVPETWITEVVSNLQCRNKTKLFLSTNTFDETE